MYEATWAQQVNTFRRVYHEGDIDRGLLDELERDRVSSERDELRLVIPNLMLQLKHMDVYAEETGIDDPFVRDFDREQLEYHLQRWEKKGYGETDWTKEYQWVLERNAAVWTDESFVGAMEEYDEVIAAAENPTSREQLVKVQHYLRWVRAQAPDAWRHASDYWSDYTGPLVDESIMLANPVMPEFN
ncbi:hypothetical protein ACTXMG_05200 [Corynebacterium flavescens]|uniref:hypothetical protein n=1 Tax=Corynebacterium flavescens TaxID=28028 RepID=UPI003FD45532